MDKSTWLKDIEIPPARSSLKESISSDVVIVGGGLAGTLTAYLLAKKDAKKKIVLLEKKDITNTTTAYTTAWLTCLIDTDLHKLVSMYGYEGAKKIWRSGMEAIDLIEKIAVEEKIDCDFMRVSHYRFATTESEMKNLKKEYETAEILGLKTILHDHKFLNFVNHGSLETPSQAKFHPLKFLIGLRGAAVKYGVNIYENTEVKEIKDLFLEKRAVAVTSDGSIEASYCLITTHDPFNKPRELFAHKAKYVSFVIEATIPLGIVPEGLYEDEENPYHYFRIDNISKEARLILGGEDHRKGIPIPHKKNYDALIAYLEKLFPNIKYEIKEKWDGFILETIDGLPYIGAYSETAPYLMVATGFSGNGMTYSAVAGEILSDIILKNNNPYAKLYHAGRKTRLFNFLEKFVDFSGEFFGGAVKNIIKF